MIESDRLDRVKAVYTNEKGQTAVSSDLRAASSKSIQEKSIYAAHAALGLTISDVILQGCQPVVVEGPSDQHYMSALKTYLIGKGHINPSREIVFVPGGGTKAIKAVASILSSKEEELPYVILDSDYPGKELAKNLKGSLYAAQNNRIVLVGELLGKDGTEIEDFFPKTIIAEAFSRSYHGREEDFIDAYDESLPIVSQMESFATKHNLKLELGWKVDLAKAVKRRVQMNPTLLDQYPDLLEVWKRLFSGFSESIVNKYSIKKDRDESTFSRKSQSPEVHP